MTHYRSEIRAALKLGFRIDPRLASLTLMSAWAQSVDPDTLPVIGVATPTEAKDETAIDSADRTVTVLVVLKRQGGDEIEDTLDDDSAPIEARVLTDLRTLGYGAMLDTTTISVDGGAERRIGTLVMTFRALLTTPEPLTL